MTMPTGFTFFTANGQFLNWYLKDVNTARPIVGAAVTASLYFGRSPFDPVGTPGTVVANFSNITLADTTTTDPINGELYQGLITAAFNPTPGGGYTLVVDASASGYLAQHWEVPAVVSPRNQ